MGKTSSRQIASRCLTNTSLCSPSKQPATTARTPSATMQSSCAEYCGKQQQKVCQQVCQSNDNCDSSEVLICKMKLDICCKKISVFITASINASINNSKNSQSKHLIPTKTNIYGFVRVLFALLQLDPQCCVSVDVYLRRLVYKFHQRIGVNNWKQVLVGACLIASKFVEDYPQSTREFAKILKDCSKDVISSWEQHTLQCLDWTAFVSRSEYTMRYLELSQSIDTPFDWNVQAESIKPYFSLSTNYIHKVLIRLDMVK